MRVVLVHGRAAQYDIPATMRRDWDDALRFGLQRVESGIKDTDIDVRLAFYGDIWRPDFRQPLPVIEPAPAEEGLGLAGVGDISLWLDEHLGVGAGLLEVLLRDLDDYFTEPELHALTNDRLVSAIRTGLKAGEQVIVVGFSMGSIVAYDTLRADGKLPVAALLTIGSPLAMPSFYRRVEASAPAGLPPANRTPVPGQLAMWVNVWTRDDPATAGHVQMASRYRPLPPSAVELQDVETWGRVASPTGPTAAHDALDYLSSRVFATALDAAVSVARG
jgi:pimeloyl-ACP methyl ester carboxylesterase